MTSSKLTTSKIDIYANGDAINRIIDYATENNTIVKYTNTDFQFGELLATLEWGFKKYILESAIEAGVKPDDLLGNSFVMKLTFVTEKEERRWLMELIKNHEAKMEGMK